MLRPYTSHQEIATMAFTHLSTIILTLLVAFSSKFAAASTPSFPDMTCSGSRSGTCTMNDGYCFYTCAPGNAPFFTFGLVGNGSKCHSNSASRRTPIHWTFIDLDVQPTRVKPREPQGGFTQNNGSALPEGHCIVSCDRTQLNYESCSHNGAAHSLLDSQLRVSIVLAGAVLMWLGHE